MCNLSCICCILLCLSCRYSQSKLCRSTGLGYYNPRSYVSSWTFICVSDKIVHLNSSINCDLWERNSGNSYPWTIGCISTRHWPYSMRCWYLSWAVPGPTWMPVLKTTVNTSLAEVYTLWNLDVPIPMSPKHTQSSALQGKDHAPQKILLWKVFLNTLSLLLLKDHRTSSPYQNTAKLTKKDIVFPWVMWFFKMRKG